MDKLKSGIKVGHQLPLFKKQDMLSFCEKGKKKNYPNEVFTHLYFQRFILIFSKR